MPSTIPQGDRRAGIHPGSPSYFSTLIPPGPPIHPAPHPASRSAPRPEVPLRHQSRLTLEDQLAAEAELAACPIVETRPLSDEQRRALEAGRKRPTFNPDDETTARIFHDFRKPRLHLGDIADTYNTSVEALSCWMARPDIAERMANLNSASATRLRFASIDNLHIARESLVNILMEFNDSACHDAALKEGRGFSPAEHNRRDKESARKACALLLRLATFDPNRPHFYRPQNPRGHAGAAEAAPTTPSTPPTHATIPFPTSHPPLPPSDLPQALSFLLNHLQFPAPTSDAPEPVSPPAHSHPHLNGAAGSPTTPLCAPSPSTSHIAHLDAGESPRRPTSHISSHPARPPVSPTNLIAMSGTPSGRSNHSPATPRAP